MGLCAPAVVAAHAALESSAADDRLIVVPGQLVKVAGVFQFMGRVGQRREGHAVPCKADAYIQSAAGDSCTVHAGAAAALLRVDRGVLGKILPDVVVPVSYTHLALLLPRFFGLDGVLYSMPMSDILTFLIAGYLICKTYRELNQKGEV